MKKESTPAKKSGFILATTMLTLAMIAMLISMLMHSSSQEAFSSQRTINNTKAKSYAEAGIEYALGSLMSNWHNRTNAAACTPNNSATESFGTGSYTLTILPTNGACIVTSAGECNGVTNRLSLRVKDYSENKMADFVMFIKEELKLNDFGHFERKIHSNGKIHFKGVFNDPLTRGLWPEIENSVEVSAGTSITSDKFELIFFNIPTQLPSQLWGDYYAPSFGGHGNYHDGKNSGTTVTAITPPAVEIEAEAAKTKLTATVLVGDQTSTTDQVVTSDTYVEGSVDLGGKTIEIQNQSTLIIEGNLTAGVIICRNNSHLICLGNITTTGGMELFGWDAGGIFTDHSLIYAGNNMTFDGIAYFDGQVICGNILSLGGGMIYNYNDVMSEKYLPVIGPAIWVR